MSSNVDTVRTLYAAFSSKDEATLRGVLDPHVEWVQCAGFPGGDQRVGVDQVLEKVFEGLRDAWIGFEVVVEEYLDAGDTVVALGHYAGTFSGSGRPMQAVFAHVYDLKGGKVTRFRQYADTAPMVDATR